jgi:hypothetical protein
MMSIGVENTAAAPFKNVTVASRNRPPIRVQLLEVLHRRSNPVKHWMLNHAIHVG